MLLWCDHGPQLLCSIALCLLGSGESWAQTKNPALGLPTPSTKCFPCQGPSWILSIVSLQVLLMSELSRLHDTWSKQRTESKDGVYSPQRTYIFLIGINGSRKKELEFFYFFSEWTSPWSNQVGPRSNSQLHVPHTHLEAWKSSLLSQETPQCIFVPAVNPRHSSVTSSSCTSSPWAQVRKRVIYYIGRK